MPIIKFAFTTSLDSRDAICDLYEDKFFDTVEKAKEHKKEVHEDDPMIKIFKITVQEVK